MSLFSNFRVRAAKRAAYRQTLRELNALSDHEAEDLGFSKADVRRIAHQAVYG